MAATRGLEGGEPVQVEATEGFLKEKARLRGSAGGEEERSLRIIRKGVSRTTRRQ